MIFNGCKIAHWDPRNAFVHKDKFVCTMKKCMVSIATINTIFEHGHVHTKLVIYIYIRYYLSRIVRKPDFAYAKTKAQISCAVTAQLISAFVFATRIVQFLFYLNPKFQDSSLLLWLYRSVCVRHGRKPRRPVFSRRGSFILDH